MTQKVKQDITKAGSDNGFKTIVILDDDRDITTTFRTILESDLISKHKITLRFRVCTSNNPVQFHSIRSMGCFIKKPISAEDLIHKVRIELE
jgi:hypothetical protein